MLIFNEAYIKKMINYFKNIQDINFNIDKINKDTSIDVLTGGPPLSGLFWNWTQKKSYQFINKVFLQIIFFNRMSFIISLLRPRIFLI